ncbi:MAG: SurA N-terminal domain-containing protein [Paracoccaceae bacterium]
MLNLLRRGVKTWVAKLLFGLLVASFAVWGIGDVFSFGLGSSVATIGDQKIPAERFAGALNRETRAASQRFGQPLDPEMVRALGLPQTVLGRLAQEATLDQAMADLKVSAPDDAVRGAIVADPGFASAAGGFDQDSYRYVLAQNGFTAESYEETTRRALARRQLVQALSDGAVAPAGAVEALYAFQSETRRFDYITLGADQAGEIGEPDEAALSAYHDANPEAFSDPERRSAVFLHLALAEIGAAYEPDEADLQALYAARASDYDRPERRELYQIVYDAEPEAAAAAARIASGEADFDALLTERRESRADVALGDVTRNEVSAAAGEAAFALGAPGVAGPVSTGFGFALIDVASITPPETTPFEAARESLAVELRREHALDLAPELAGEIEERRAGGATLEDIAAELKLSLNRAELVAADGAGGEGFAKDPAFLEEMFAAEEGEERDLIETPGGEFFVLRVEAIAPAAVRPLAEARDDVASAWRLAEIRDALAEKAAAFVARLDGGEALSTIAEDPGFTVMSEGPKTRGEGWAAIPPELLEALFDAPLGHAGFAPAGENVTIATVAAIDAGAPTAQNLARRESLERQMNEMAANDALALFIAAKQAEVGVSVNNQVLDSLLSQSGGL